MKIAIIGSGISSLTAAYLLHDRHEVTVFEADDRIGGHTATKQINYQGESHNIDTGFIVYNDWTYPNFIRLMTQLGVQSRPAEMSYSVTDELSKLEYSGTNLNSLFAQRSNLISPRFWSMLRDIMRFNRESVAHWRQGKIPAQQSLREYLVENRYGKLFTHQYLVPMGAAIWSSGDQVMLDFPVEFFIRFFNNHGLLSVNNRPQWRTLVGGSQAYLEPLTKGFAQNIKLNTRIAAIERQDQGVNIRFDSGEVERFDQVVIGTHSDQALKLLGDASQAEIETLSAIPYQPNEVVLHTDTSVLPERKLAWSSWNSRLLQQQHEKPVLTYNMNILQGLKSQHTFCVTLNHTAAIDPDKILGVYHYDHPEFTVPGVAAQARWADINGRNNTWFCGAYWANGFHEDGVNSGIRVATALGAKW
ncbi:FAD-dependent oxidoreductase [Simiduia curdlanivorans]|uniref:NAD(P)/FAD-dependent oxidoreductase n=1 Tax=Simiduia curdlanivorans TaxID=1492769 RepID=A0ABV8V2Y1_9GAMM|nr:FAD-dependent oxidoreductase [Simiduia curdlanivorans]MDN3640973.1 FAD-dependent oxidoreductase [Simiduia curdlanivorans]